jgi:hypothetical protein
MPSTLPPATPLTLSTTAAAAAAAASSSDTGAASAVAATTVKAFLDGFERTLSDDGISGGDSKLNELVWSKDFQKTLLVSV